MMKHRCTSLTLQRAEMSSGYTLPSRSNLHSDMGPLHCKGLTWSKMMNLHINLCYVSLELDLKSDLSLYFRGLRLGLAV